MFGKYTIKKDAEKMASRIAFGAFIVVVLLLVISGYANAGTVPLAIGLWLAGRYGLLTYARGAWDKADKKRSSLINAGMTPYQAYVETTSPSGGSGDSMGSDAFGNSDIIEPLSDTSSSDMFDNVASGDINFSD